MSRPLRLLLPALLLASAFASLLTALAIGGGAEAPLLTDPGAVVRYGLPAASLLVNLGAAGTLGSLVLVIFALTAGTREYDRALDVAAASAGAWAVASAITGFFTFLSVYQQPFSLDAEFGGLLGSFITDVDLGRSWLITTLVAAMVTVLCFAVRNHTAVLFVTAFAAVGLVPMALQGHAAGASGHDAAISSLGLHIVFAAVWLGGLLAVVAIRPSADSPRLATLLSRYSSVALVCFIVVAVSGYVNAALRVGSLSGLATPYGLLVVGKVVALLALGILGAVQRRRIIGRIDSAGGAGSNGNISNDGSNASIGHDGSIGSAGRVGKAGGRGGRMLALVVAFELAFMGLASGVAAALARTNPLVPEVPVTATPANILTGESLPPEPTFASYFTQWRFDVIWVIVVGFLAFFYLAGVIRLRRRGDSWPVHRTVFWLAGLATLLWVTCGGLNVYEKYLFSTHMLAHMLLGMMIPLMLVPGAPITLALRTIAKRHDGSRGGREWIMLAVHSRYANVLVNPIVAAVIFVTSLWVFYYTPVFRWATTDHIGHEWMIVHFLITGYLFVQSLIGVDPVPYRAPYPMRLVLLLGTMAFHAFFGLSLMTGSGLLLADWYGAMGRDWGPSAIVDQQNGGGIAWSIGEIPTIILAVVVSLMWSRSDGREAKRLDRKADRDGGAELDRYNDMLAGLKRRS